MKRSNHLYYRIFRLERNILYFFMILTARIGVVNISPSGLKRVLGIFPETAKMVSKHQAGEF